MKKSKAKFWLIFWLIVGVLCSIVLRVEEVVYYFQNGVALQCPPYTTLQMISFFGVTPFVLIPMLIKAFYHAVQERRKWLKILSGFLLFYHVLAVIIFLLTVTGLI